MWGPVRSGLWLRGWRATGGRAQAVGEGGTGRGQTQEVAEVWQEQGVRLSQAS